MIVRPFELLFESTLTAPVPDTAYARIALSSFSREGDHIVLSEECRSIGELEHAVRHLKDDLDRVLAEAYKKFPRTQGGRD